MNKSELKNEILEYINTLFISSFRALDLESAMEFHQSNRFLSILRDSVKLVFRNLNLIVLIAIISVFLNAIFVLLFAHSVQSLVHNMNASIRSFSLSSRRGFDPRKKTLILHQLREDAAFLFVLEVAFILAFSVISFFSTISTIIISTVSCNSKNPSLKELFSMFRRSWTRPFITNFYASSFTIAYFVFVFMFVAPLWLYPNLSIFVLGALIVILSFIFYFYLVVPWILAIVVSVAEESLCGLEALGRAAALVKGKRLHGFLLNVIYGVSATIIFQFYRMKMGEKELATMSLMLVMSVFTLVKMLLFVAYTVFYFQCKMHHGEEIELHGSVQYTKLPTTILP